MLKDAIFFYMYLATKRTIMKKQNGAFFRFKKEMVDSDREIEWDENEGNFSKICKNSIFVQYILI